MWYVMSDVLVPAVFENEEPEEAADPPAPVSAMTRWEQTQKIRDDEKRRAKSLEEHDPTTENPIPKHSYTVVIADVNYGLAKKSSRDDTRWNFEQFEGFFANVKDANEAEEFVTIVFLHDDQFQVSRNVCCSTSAMNCPIFRNVGRHGAP
jgi:hypothetical protein